VLKALCSVLLITWLTAAHAQGFYSVSSGLPPEESVRQQIDQIVVYKGERRLDALKNGKVIRQYPLKLGLSPKGHKEREGDFRTPEGDYFISSRNTQSSFYLSLGISYPNAADRARARREGVSPGSLIMIHGEPERPTKPPQWYEVQDWTDGCIALKNGDMADLWLRTPVGTPITIKP
jgi:murein L,D-transpeptidase YafK